MNVESVTTIQTRPGVQTARDFHINPRLAAQTEMEAVLALGVQAVKRQAKVRAARIKEVQARLAAGTYQQDSQAIAQKMLEME